MGRGDVIDLITFFIIVYVIWYLPVKLIATQIAGILDDFYRRR